MKSDEVINQVLQNDVRLVGILIFLSLNKDNCVCCNWLKTVEERYLQTVDSDGNIFWEAYCANQQPAQGNPPAITAMLSLFHEDSKSCCHDTSL